MSISQSINQSIDRSIDRSINSLLKLDRPLLASLELVHKK